MPAITAALPDTCETPGWETFVRYYEKGLLLATYGK